MKEKGTSDPQRHGKLNTIIGKGTVVTGDMQVQNSLRVDGTIRGKVNVTDTVLIGKEGKVEGEIIAKDVMIGGKIEGNVQAAGKVLLETNAQITGDIKASQLVVDEGATFDGKCVMKQNGINKNNSDKS